MAIKDYLTIKEFAEQTGLSESYVRALISKGPHGEEPRIDTMCPVQGMRRPRLIHVSLVAQWKYPTGIGRPRLATL